jgi:TonB family protein
MRQIPHITKSAFLIALLLAVTTVVSGQAAPAPPAPERERGIEYLHRQKYKEAIDSFKLAVKKDASDPQTWYYLGMALLQNAKTFKDATKAFETAVKLSSNSAALRAGLAYSLLLRNKDHDAAREANQALAIDPNLSDAHYVLGVVLLRSGKRDEALQHAEAAIKLQPQAALPYLLKSQALVSFTGGALRSDAGEELETRRSRFREAAAPLERYLELSPNPPNKQLLVDQLESLRVYSKGDEGQAANKLAFSGKEVSVKARVLSKPEPSYTEAARQSGVTGIVVLRCVFGADGVVKHLLVIQGLPLGLTEQALKAARRIKFTPAMKDGVPVSMYIQLEYNFNLF